MKADIDASGIENYIELPTYIYHNDSQLLSVTTMGSSLKVNKSTGNTQQKR